MSDEQLIEELSLLFSKEIENDNQRYTDTIYDEVIKNKNIIEELEKYLKEEMIYYRLNIDYYVQYELTLEKLQELKEGK